MTGTKSRSDVHVLTPAQHKVARLYAAGLPASEIARRQGVKLRTVRSHIEAVYQRLGVCRRDLARALLTADVQTVMTRPANRAGMRRGDPVQMIGGRFAGKTGVYYGHSNGQQWKIEINGVAFHIMAKYVEPINNQGAPHA